MLLIYIFLKMPKNLPCTEWIFIRPKWVEVEFESVRVENVSCLGLGECRYQHRCVRQWSSCLSRQTAYQSICLAKDSEDLLQEKILLHQTSSEWCKSRTQVFFVDQVTLLVRSIREHHWFQTTHLSCCKIPLENRRGTSCVFPVDSWSRSRCHHSLPSLRLRRPEELRKRPILPRFNSTFRYTGNYTYHQARQLLLDRPNPDFERSLSKRMAKSMDVCKSLSSCFSLAWLNGYLFPVEDEEDSGDSWLITQICFFPLSLFLANSYHTLTPFSSLAIETRSDNLESDFSYDWSAPAHATDHSTASSTSAKCRTILRNPSHSTARCMSFSISLLYLSSLPIFYRHSLSGNRHDRVKTEKEKRKINLHGFAMQISSFAMNTDRSVF